MHVRIHHSTVYRYDPPAAGAIQLLRLTPRDFDGQHVVRWRIELSADARLTPHEDAFGNLTHVFTAAGPLAELRVDVDRANLAAAKLELPFRFRSRTTW